MINVDEIDENNKYYMSSGKRIIYSMDNDIIEIRWSNSKFSI